MRVALERPREFVLLSVRAMADRLKTDPATMVRIVRGMQFASYRDFQHYLHELSLASATSLDTMQTQNEGKFTSSKGIQTALDQDLRNLTRFVRGTQGDRVADLCRRLYQARRIILIGGDLATSLVRYLEYHLTVLGLPVTAATTPGEVVHRVRLLGKKDVVLAVSFRRGLRQTVEGLRHARRKGAYCIAVANSTVSAINEFAHETFVTPVDSPAFGDSYVAPMALMNLIVVGCANYRRNRTLALMKEVEQEQKHGFRWYEAQ